MSASALRRKSYKKAQEESGPFSPVHWEDQGGGGELPAGKLQVMEKFFTPVHQAKEEKQTSDRALRDCRRCQQWTESRSGRFSTLSSSSSTSASSSTASWSSEASLEKEAFPLADPRYHPQHSQSCVDISREHWAFRRGREEDKAAREATEMGCSFVGLRRGQSKSADRLPRHRLAHRELPPLPGQADGADRQLYKTSSLERSLAFPKEAEISARRQALPSGIPAPSKGILKNGAVSANDGLRKAKSIETITVQSSGREARTLGPGPIRPLQRARQPPNSLDLSTPQKPPAPERTSRLEQKLRFSEFLNEITRQVMSPSSLSSLGWRPPEAPLDHSKPPSTNGSDSKGSSVKSSSPGSPPEMAEGRVRAEMDPLLRRRPGHAETRGDAAHNRHDQHHPKSPEEATPSPGSGPLAYRLPASLGSLPILFGEAAQGQRKLSGTKPGRGVEPVGQDRHLKKEKDPATGAEKPSSKEVQGSGPVKAAFCTKELLEKVNTEQTLSPEGQAETTIQKDQKALPLQPDLQKTWEEMEDLKDKFTRLQEEYLDTRITNKLLEEKLQSIAQNMAEERNALNQRINELVERLINAQSTISTLEKINISGLLSKPATRHHRVEKAESLDSLCSLHILDVAPPPAFMDGASDARTTPSQSDSATEAGKLGCSSESDTAGPDRERTPLLAHDGLGAPLVEAGKRHSKTHSRAFTPWKEKSTTFSAEQVNSTESECSGEEMAAFCNLPTPPFLYLRQETLVTPTGRNSFPVVAAPRPAGLEEVLPSSPSGGLPSRGQLELVPELSSSDSSEDGTEVSWSPGLVEKASRSPLDYASAQKMLNSLLHKSSGQEKSREAEARRPGRPGGSHRLAGSKDGAGSGRVLGHQPRWTRYYQDFPSSEERSSEVKDYPGSPPHATRSHSQGSAVEPAGDEAVQDSTSL